MGRTLYLGLAYILSFMYILSLVSFSFWLGCWVGMGGWNVFLRIVLGCAGGWICQMGLRMTEHGIPMVLSTAISIAVAIRIVT